MFRLTTKLACSNLIKNRKLYYPFAIAVILAVTIAYLFDSLTFNPHIHELRGGSSILFTLGLGLFVVNAAGAIIVLYANSFVMKNRSKELGLYSMLGLEKRHLISMIFKELLIFGFVTISSGILIGALFDKLIFAFLLKLMKMKVQLVSTFQPGIVITIFVTFGLIFALLGLLNAWRILRLNALQLTREKASGEKKARFLWPQTILGLASLGFGYYLALSVKDPMSAILIFFLAVVLVMIGTYLLFNAGITVFLHLLKKKKSYYYQPNNMISVSNLIYRMKKNAVGLATIAILSTMVLVTISAATNIYIGGEMIKKIMNPHDFSIQGKGVDLELINQKFDEFASEHQLEIKNRDLMNYATFGVESQKGTDFTVYPDDEHDVRPRTVFLVFDAASYEQMTGEDVDLTGNQVILFAHNKALKGQKQFTINGQDFQVKEEVTKDFITDHVPNIFNMLTEDFNYLIVPDLSAFVAKFPNLAVVTQIYGGFNVNIDEEHQLKLADSYDKLIDDFSSQLTDMQFVYGGNRAYNVREMNSLFGGIFFIGIFLSLIFMVGTVIVIYYKQISEGYEDRDRFVILQQVGLDEDEVKRTINRQVRTVFFLPLIFAFVHLAFAYHMIRLILKVLGVINSSQVLVVTLSVCAVFLVTYLVVFWITSRSYRKIVQI
ncbi:FtsX-like permease family protein [Streptococcus koreensis]|uniref:FtsX-like permease family protein n=1 Tax=Streptococcus koreensis TaxID=2382163 RepID=UPI0022E8C581|nr:ABC transporter permease [Streptococcus koreensis]